MPQITHSTIRTKTLGVGATQDVLLFMYEEPWSVEMMFINEKGGVMVKFVDGPFRQVGMVNEKYREFYKCWNLAVRSWEITGGQPLAGYSSYRGQLLAYFGLNLHLSIPSRERSRKDDAASLTSIPEHAPVHA